MDSHCEAETASDCDQQGVHREEIQYCNFLHMIHESAPRPMIC